MAEELNIHTAMGAVNLFMGAVKNCRFYPETSDIVQNSIEMGYKRLLTVFYRDASLVVSESDGSVLFDGRLLDPKFQKMPQVCSLKGLMDTLDIKSITFDPGIDQENYASLARVLSLHPDEVAALGGVHDMIEAAGLSGVAVNHKVYVSAEYETFIESDEELFRHIWFNQVSEPQALGYVGKKMGEMAWLDTVGQRFLAYAAGKGAETTDWTAISGLASLWGFLIKAAVEQEKPQTYCSLHGSLDALGPYFSCDVLALNHSEGEMAEVVELLDDKAFALLSARLLLIKRSGRRGIRLMDPSHLRYYISASDWMLNLPKGIALKYAVDELRKCEEKHQAEALARIEALLSELVGGNADVLNHPEVRAALPRSVAERIEAGALDEAEKLIHAISFFTNLEEETQAMAAVQVLLETGRVLIRQNSWEMVNRVIVPLNLWVRYQGGVTPLYESACDLMINHAHSLIVSGQFGEATSVVETFHLIVQGRLKKNGAVTQYAGKVMRRIASERVFNATMEEFRKNGRGLRDHASHLLVLFGAISVPPLLDMLRESEAMGERIRTMVILKTLGPEALPEMMVRIKGDTSWFYLRNLLKVLGEVGSEEHVEALEPLLVRSEEQVIEAVIACVKQIGGAKRARFFSKALLQVPDVSKPQLADLLGQMGGDEALYALSQVLRYRSTTSPEGRNKVILAACRALGAIGVMKGLPPLQRVVDQKGLLGRSRYTAEQKDLAEAMIAKIRRAMVKTRVPSKQSSLDARLRVTREYIEEEEYATLEAVVAGLISGEKRASALKMLLLMVERASREKDFHRAEKYKSRLPEVDEWALGEVVRAEEMIAQEKQLVDSGEHMETWKTLYAALTPEEASGFYYHLKNESLDVDCEIIRQGKIIGSLYFINSGTLKIIYKNGPKEMFIKELGRGAVAGYDAFFRTNVSTASLVTLSRVKLGVLDRESLVLLEEHYPGFSEKLQFFCGQFDNISEAVQAKGVERRRYNRFDIHGKAALQLMTEAGAPVGKAFSGALIDISEGGISVEVKSSGYAIARLLLGRSIRSIMKSGDHAERVLCEGRVMSVNARGDMTISIHIAFEESLDLGTLETFVTSQ